MKNIIIASTSTIHGSGYLEYLLPTLQVFYKNVNEILFVPYARPSGISYKKYTEIAQKAFGKIGVKVKGIHEFSSAKEAVTNAKGIIIGGGNTFELVNQLYKNDIIKAIRTAVNKETPYLGTSAGSNICGPTMMTTNDMPIVYPPSFDTLNLIDYTINPHYLDADLNSTHKGETRETRINEFHVYNNSVVIGLREGSWLEVKGEKIILKGKLTARIFQQNKKPIELVTESVLDFNND
jgi:dipeptidase E